MAHQLFANNASSILAADCLIGATTVQVQIGEGVKFPSPIGPEFFTAALEDVNGNIEIVICTDVTGDVLTVTRAQESTAEQNFLQDVSRIECRPTAAVMASFLQSDEAIFTADADLNGNALINGEIVGVPLRGTSGDTSNQLVVPTGGNRPTIGGIDILIATDVILPPGLIGMWSGLIGDIPSGWALCNGGNGTPDLSGKFIVSYDAADIRFDTVGNEGGSFTSDPAGAHDHGGASGNTTLDAADIPSLTLDTNLGTSNNSSDNHTLLDRAAAGANNSALVPDNTGVAAYDNPTPTAHNHSISNQADHTHDQIPVFYVLAFIMKLATP